jgi:hypothetical protein
MFSYDHNHPVYRFVIWSAASWPMILDTEVTIFAREFQMKYDFSYPRVGGVDPCSSLLDKELADMKAELDRNPYGFTFEVDWAGYIPGDRVDHYPYPRFIYSPPSGKGDNVTYCGEKEEGGPWPDCNPERYNVDGPVERLLTKGVSRIVMVDLTVGGVRFSKTFDVVHMTKTALNKWNAEHGTSIPLVWINDYSSLMERSYPTEPEGWTRSLGPVTKDSHVLLSGSPNPIAEDPELAQLHVEGIEAAMSSQVPDSKTGVILINHQVLKHNEVSDQVFDPKTSDTLIVNKNIKSQLLERHPEMDPDNIVGAFVGIEKLNPENGLVENSREMRGERVGCAYLYQSGEQMPGGSWGYRYWDALTYLKNRGAKHIVIAFPQVSTDSVLNLIEVPNQFGKEIGTKTWAKWGTWDYATYPGVGHPFADYWGNWVNTDCGGVPCCFEMGGCADGRPYPPPRQTPVDTKMNQFDPSLAYDLSDYGHLGYDPAKGPPDPNAPVQDQYTGTWDMWTPPNDDPRVGKFLARHVLSAISSPMVYITNDEFEGVKAGQSVTFEARVVTGTPPYAYGWSLKKEGATDWNPVGEDRATWTWTPVAREAGGYDVKCETTDADGGTGEVTWRSFDVVS